MGQFIIHKDGAYNIYSTISDGPHYVSALTLKELEEVIRTEFGEAGMRILPERLERAHDTGCSSLDGTNLRGCICGNRAGPNETKVPYDEFIAKYLTLPKAEDGQTVER